MTALYLVSYFLLWAGVLGLGFLLIGVLRALALVQWRLEQLEATTPSRLNRSGLAVGKQAPAFALHSTLGQEITLTQFADRRVLLVFVQAGCGPCAEIVPELNRLKRRGEIEVLAISNAAGEIARDWAADVGAEFPVLVQSQLAVSKRYEVFATPFAFVIDQQGVIAARGIINSPQQISFLLDDAAGHANQGRRQETVLAAAAS